MGISKLIDGTTLLQFNATIIVGVFLFLTLSSGLFGQGQESTAKPRAAGAFDWDKLVHNTITVPPSALFIQLGLTTGTIIPFAASSYVIISNGESLDKAKHITKIGIVILLIVLGVLLLNARQAQYS